MWFARSPEVIHSHLMETLVWLRVPGDVVFAIGTVCLALFAFRLLIAKKAANVSLNSSIPAKKTKQA
jgi:nitric oxide reductase subunit B